MRKLPVGTVTLLFTDIEGSTKLLHELGADRYAGALGEHRRLLRSAFAGHGGAEVDTEGDAFFYTFVSAEAAVAAAREAQRALAAGPIRVRMGLHTGEPQLTAEGYVGLDVHKTARIAACAHGGQVVLSGETGAGLDAEDDLLDLGEHRLKDFAEPVWIYQLGNERFPPLKTISNTNLPRPASSFVGREREVADVVRLLRDGARLVTLTGPGGSGKTRLAIESADEIVPRFRNGVFWVELAALRDPALVTEMISQTLGVKGELNAHIGDRDLLLLLDNFEQVVEAAPGLSSLLRACPNLSFLITSRELLRIEGEVEYAVLPLAVSEAVELFCDRARVEPDDAITELCQRLDNLPLAVELAAARTRVLSPAQILARISQRLDLLTGSRHADVRQRTLRATIEWSYDLLSEHEQRLFARLAVFADGCALEAAEQVAWADLDTLQSLVEKSLVRHTRGRFWMLETIREYALERLDESDEATELRLKQARFLLALAESANLTVERYELGEQRQELVIPEADNIRSALDWALAAGEITLATSLAVALEQYWVTNSPHEGARRLAELLSQGEEVATQLRARALRACGGSTYIAGDYVEGTRWHEQALTTFRQLGDEQAIAHMLFRSAVEANRTGDPGRARELCEASRSLHTNTLNEAQIVRLLGDIAFAEGRGEEALGLLLESARLARECGFRWWQSAALTIAAGYAIELGQPEDAHAAAAEAVVISQAIGDRQGTVYALATLARVAAAAGQAQEAGRLWGAIETEEQRGPIGQWEDDRDTLAGSVLVADGPEFQRGRNAGRRLTLVEAVAAALPPTTARAVPHELRQSST